MMMEYVKDNEDKDVDSDDDDEDSERKIAPAAFAGHMDAQDVRCDLSMAAN